MMLPLLLLSLSAAPAERVLVLDLEPGSASSEEASILSGRVASAVSRAQGFEVISEADLRDMVELEAERQAIDECDSSSCMAEIASALGTRFVVNGQLGRLGDQWVLQLRLFDSENARAAAREEVTARGMDELAEKVEAAALSLIGAAPAPAAGPSGLVIGGGGALAAGAAVAIGFGTWAFLLDQRLVQRGVPREEKSAILQNGYLTLVGAGAGAGLALVGGALLLVGAAE